MPGAAPQPAFSEPGPIVPETRVGTQDAATEIRAECIRRPGNPAPKGKAPEGGKPYKVQDGDTWSNLARRQGMDAWSLIRFNFPNLPEDVRAASPEVNWYMCEYVGCDLVTPDGRNFRFSSSARPGLIYIPGTPLPPSVPALRTIVEVQHWRFWTALPYLHRAMTMNAQSQDAAEIRELADVQPAMAVERWVRLVRPNGRWDHDAALRRMLALDPDLHFPIEGDREHEYFYGIWIEIHHGFVAAAAGLSPRLLETGNPIDNECILLGAQLWMQHGLDVTPRHIYTELLARRLTLLAIQESPRYLESVGRSGHRHIQNISNGE